MMALFFNQKSYTIWGFIWMFLTLVGIFFSFVGNLFASNAQKILSLVFLKEILFVGIVFFLPQLLLSFYCFWKSYRMKVENNIQKNTTLLEDK